MPLHDWTRVPAGTFHGFHMAWLAAIRGQLNNGLLPPGYYADAEQVARPYVADVLTLREPATLFAPNGEPGGVAVAAARPRTRRRSAVRPQVERPRPRHVVIRHTSGHRVVALIEVASPANKDRRESVESFAQKAAAALRDGVHVLLIDVLPIGRHDPAGLARAVVDELRGDPDPDDADPGQPADVDLAADEPLGFASFEAGSPVNVYLEPRAVGADVPAMPLFLAAGRYVDVPLADSYQRAWDDTPRFWRDVVAPPG